VLLEVTVASLLCQLPVSSHLLNFAERDTGCKAVSKEGNAYFPPHSLYCKPPTLPPPHDSPGQLSISSLALINKLKRFPPIALS